jgi:hypothetical protein
MNMMAKMKLVVVGIAESTQSRGPAPLAGMRPVRFGEVAGAITTRSKRATN